MTRRTFGMLVIMAASTLAGCDDDDETGALSLPDISPPGWLDVRLTGAPGNSEALLFQVVGGRVDSVSSENYTVFATPQAPDQLRVILIGNLANDVVARIWVPNPSAVGLYRAVLEQAAAGQDFRQQSVLGYSLKVEAPARR